jgi:hypothetical protein
MNKVAVIFIFAFYLMFFKSFCRNHLPEEKIKLITSQLLTLLAFLILLVAFIVLLFRRFCLFKIEHYPIYAIPQTGWRGTIFKNMAQVRLATAALHFGALHSMGVIGRINNASLADGLVKAGPAAAAFEFGIAFKQGVAANSAVIGSNFLAIFKLAGPGPLGALLPCNGVHIGRQYLSPFFFSDIHLRRVGAGINRVLF